VIQKKSLANPWLDFLPPVESRDLASHLNDDLNALCAKSRGRLYGFGVLPTLSAEGCVDELENISKLGQLRGVIMGTHGIGKG
jgi:aminocarboxymuconate-semialdehyde decarboxylase